MDVAIRCRFGHLRRLPSGRWQASYRTAGGERRTAAKTFATKTDADRWLSTVESDLVRGTWVDATLAKMSFGEPLSRSLPGAAFGAVRFWRSTGRTSTSSSASSV